MPAAPIQKLPGGSVNHTFAVGHDDERCVIRIAIDPMRVDEFMSEAWCLRLAAAHGIASPEVVAVGTLEGVPYAVHRFIPHLGQDSVSGRHLWTVLGRYARTIHKLPITDHAPDNLFTRFGRDLSAAWRAHLAYHLAELTRTDRLIALGVYSEADQPPLRQLILRLVDTPMRFGLNHGDLASRNVLVRPDRQLVLIDWGSAACGPVPYLDLLILLRDHEQNADPSTDELAAFADGYGLDLEALLPTLHALRKLTALDLVRWAIDRRPDRLPELVDRARRELVRSAIG
jgi:Ser/Thr protein kinase RdoA (MazF antagonist)